MFGLFKRGSAPTPPPSAGDDAGPVIAAVLVGVAAFDVAPALPAVAKLKVNGRRATGARIDRGMLMAEWGGGIVAVAPMPAPYPWSGLEGPVATAWMWPPGTPASSVRAAEGHVLVTLVGGGGTAVERRLLVARVTAEVAALPGVLGVYWPEGTLVHYPKVFVEMARKITDPKAPPIYLLVDFRAFGNADGTSGLFTTGLAALGAMDIEIARIDMKPGELRDWAVNIAYYLLDPAVRIKDGETIGMSAEHQIKVRHRPSSHGGKGTVLRMET